MSNYDPWRHYKLLSAATAAVPSLVLIGVALYENPILSGAMLVILFALIMIVAAAMLIASSDRVVGINLTWEANFVWSYSEFDKLMLFVLHGIASAVAGLAAFWLVQYQPGVLSVVISMAILAIGVPVARWLLGWSAERVGYIVRRIFNLE